MQIFNKTQTYLYIQNLSYRRLLKVLYPFLWIFEPCVFYVSCLSFLHLYFPLLNFCFNIKTVIGLFHPPNHNKRQLKRVNLGVLLKTLKIIFVEYFAHFGEPEIKCCSLSEIFLSLISKTFFSYRNSIGGSIISSEIWF